MTINQETPLVSIIAVCYNHAKYVEETLDSILGQTYKNIETIIIDSNSSDNSVEVIQRWIDRNQMDCTFIRQREPRNICQNLNEGLALTKGEFYQGLSCDDVLMPQKINKQIALFQDLDASYALVYSDMYGMDEKGNELYDSYLSKTYNMQEGKSGRCFNDLFKNHFIPAPTLLLKTRVVKQLGGYDESLLFEDIDMNLRISRDFSIAFSSYKSAKYRIVATSLNRQLSQRNPALIYTKYKSYFKQLANIKDTPTRKVLLEKLESLLLLLYRSKHPNVRKDIQAYLHVGSDSKRLNRIYRCNLPPELYFFLGKVLHKIRTVQG